jgi:Xaa-Pro aminopeptidase
MSIPKQEYERRYSAIRQQMRTAGMDCLLVYGLSDDFNRGNIRYLTGTGRGGCCIFPLAGKPVFLINPNQSASQIRKMIDAWDLLDLKESSNLIAQVKQELSSLPKSGRVGLVGIGCVPVPLYLAVKELFQKRLVDAMSIFEDLRVVKSAVEIEKIRQAARVADRAYAMLMKLVRPGLTDFEVYGQVKKTIYEMGCEYSFDLIDAGGGRMNMTYWPTGEILKPNSTLFMEITPAYEGYYGQLPVTLPVGEYPAGIRKMIGVWDQANQAVLKILHPGTPVSDLYHVMIDVVRANGYISPLRPGHSIGLDALDFWSITAENNLILKPGMTIAVHPSIMTEIGGDACGMGYTYLITENGNERFSKVDLARS